MDDGMTTGIGKSRVALIGFMVMWTAALLIGGCGTSEPAASSPYLDGLTVKLQESSAGSAMHEYKASITDQSGQPAALDHVRLTITMSMHGMRHESKGDMKRSGDGQYTAKLKWAMDGSWKAAVTLEKDRHKKTILTVASTNP
ncbi:FixH family protein [Paenibacillus sp. MWE-103]|uniref:FixH family protein n=1 Tax=Paenibacillus artemisiicola TaxID=1172618 RepID=A0ABS3W7X8_9BACL|nr:FixH family protein [Paenibacillus artemisiicola]MBO7744235.1 FixH family protein [Paenibacillus artemisiicola]